MRTKTPFEDRLLGLVEPVAHEMGYQIVRVRVMGGSRRKRLQIMAERADGAFDVSDCAELSRAASAVLDVADPFEGEWDLEVSSPGIDRPLTQPEHFERWAGFEAKLELDRMLDGRKRFRGALLGLEGDKVVLRVEDAPEPIAVPFGWIGDAKLVLTDELVAESLKRRGPRAPGAALAEGDDYEPDPEASGENESPDLEQDDATSKEGN